MRCMADRLIRPHCWLIGSPVYWVGPERRARNRRLHNDSCRLVDRQKFSTRSSDFGTGKSSRSSIASMGGLSELLRFEIRYGEFDRPSWRHRYFVRFWQSLSAFTCCPTRSSVVSSRRGTELRMIRHFICPLIVQEQSCAKHRRVPTPKY